MWQRFVKKRSELLRFIRCQPRTLDKQMFAFMYELSLPYGLDLNDRINIDKSATRVTATMGNTTTAKTKVFLGEVDAWVGENFPGYMQDIKPTGAHVMFTYITDRNVKNMIAGTIMAILAISAIMIFALRSVRLGLLSLIPNSLPILATFGVWAVLVGEVGFSVATVASISLGIIVDDTVHFLSKYTRAKMENNLTSADAVRYAFRSVGVAILVNTVVLAIGFFVLTFSTFKVNADMGVLTALAIVFALVLDFLLLPAMLVMRREKETLNVKEREMHIATRRGERSGAVGSVTTVSVIFGCALFLLADAPAYARGESALRGLEIAQRADSTDHGFNNSEVNLTMVLRNSAGSEDLRSLKVTTLEIMDDSAGDKSLVIFSTPKDIDGTALLSHSRILQPDSQWLYLPALKRVKRISSANKSGPFVGSEFAFEDFTSTELNKYDYDYLREETCGEFTCDVLTRFPRYKYSGYTKQIAWIDQVEYQIRKVEFYDRRGALLKTLNLKDYRQYGDKFWRSHRLEMVNHQTGKSTDLLYGDYRFDVGLTERDFVKSRLTR